MREVTGIKTPSRLLSLVIRQMCRATGQIEQLERQWLSGSCRKSEGSDTSKSLEVKNFASALVLIGGGFLIGLVLLFAECMYYHFGRRTARACNFHNCCALISSVYITTHSK